MGGGEYSKEVRPATERDALVGDRLPHQGGGQGPQLAGRIAFDARLELLSESQVKQVAKLANAIGESWKVGGGNRNRLFLVDRKAERDLERVLLAEPGVRTLYTNDRLRIVALAPTAEPAG